MFIKKENTEIVEIKEDIIVVGLSLQKSGLPITFASLGKMWERFGDSYRGKDKIANALNPKLEYSILLNKVPDYITGHAVTKVGDIADECSSIVLPKGKYIKDSFNAETFEELTDKVLPKRKVKVWAKNNKVKVDGMFSVEVYPWDEFDKENFEMYTLTPIKE